MTAPHVYEAVTQVTSIMAAEGLPKGRTNQQQGYKFRGIDDVFGALSRHLATAKLCMLPRVMDRKVVERPTKSGGVSTYVVLEVEFDLVSSLDGSKHTIRTMGEAMDTADKATNKAMSAAMKYACLLAFQIPTEGDNDADAHHIEPAARNQDLTPVLQASVAMGNAEVEFAKKLKAAKTPGELLEVWSLINGAFPKGADGPMRRLAAIKDAQKQALRVT